MPSTDTDTGAARPSEEERDSAETAPRKPSAAAPRQRTNFFLRVPLVVYEALLVTALLVAIGVAYLLVSRFGFGEIFTLAPVEFMEADTHHSVLQSIAELPVPPGRPPVC